LDPPPPVPSLRSAFGLPCVTAPAALSHPDCRASLILIVARQDTSSIIIPIFSLA
jgi:hypothetical protein